MKHQRKIPQPTIREYKGIHLCTTTLPYLGYIIVNISPKEGNEKENKMNYENLK